jgi:CXXX repeat modification system protein
MKKLVGKVTVEEKDEILALFERRNGLLELSKIVTAANDALYERLVKDMGVTATKFQRWWDDASRKYGWEKDDSKQWEIDFDTCEIFLQ